MEIKDFSSLFESGIRSRYQNGPVIPSGIGSRRFFFEDSSLRPPRFESLPAHCPGNDNPACDESSRSDSTDPPLEVVSAGSYSSPLEIGYELQSDHWSSCRRACSRREKARSRRSFLSSLRDAALRALSACLRTVGDGSRLFILCLFEVTKTNITRFNKGIIHWKRPLNTTRFQ